MNKLIHELLQQRLVQNKEILELMPNLKDSVTKGVITPYSAAKQVMSLI
jgi:hypothetical protein